MEHERLRLQRLLAATAQSRRVLTHALDEEALLRQLCQILAGGGRRRAVFAALRRASRLDLVASAAAGALAEAERLASLDVGHRRGVTQTAIEAGHPCVLETFTAGGLTAPWAAEAVRLGFGQAVAIPLTGKEGVLGALSVFAGAEEPIPDDEVELLGELGLDAGHRIEELRREAASPATPAEPVGGQPAFDALAQDSATRAREAQLHGLNEQLQIEISERRRNEEGLRQRLAVERATSAISARFITPGDFDAAVQQTLEDICELAGASRAALLQLDDGGSQLSKTHEACSFEVEPRKAQFQGLTPASLPWLMGKLNARETAVLADIADLPVTSAAERQLLDAQDVRSLVAEPVLAGDALAGALVIEDTVAGGSWRDEDVALLRIAAQIIGNTLLRHRTDAALAKANQQLHRWVGELEVHNRQIRELSEMAEMLQSCTSVEEAPAIISQATRRLFSGGSSGAVFLFTASRNLLEAVATWGSDPPTERVFAPDACWALRRARTHFVRNTRIGLLCQHLGHPLPASTLCVPLMAHGEGLGVLHLHAARSGGQPDGEPGQITEPEQQLAATIADHLSLSLANLKLRETLQGLSIRDPLTSLFNRRFMQESLERDLHKAMRSEEPVGVMLLDLDHFKRFNDSHGHDAGDQLLRELGTTLLQQFRGEDVACRYGGEEFTVILPGASPADTRRRAEQLRQLVSAIRIDYQGAVLEPVTVSIGVAVFPHHASTGEALLMAADAALYRAKAAGRNCVVVAPESH